MKPYMPAIIVAFCLLIGAFAWKTFSPSHTTPTKTTSVMIYTSTTAHLQFRFAKSMYVQEYVEDVDETKQGRIVISAVADPMDTDGILTILYGMPYINGKGGACPPNGFSDRSILGQSTQICSDEATMTFFGGYPKHPSLAIEYAFAIGGNKITSDEYQTYRQIIDSAMQFSN